MSSILATNWKSIGLKEENVVSPLGMQQPFSAQFRPQFMGMCVCVCEQSGIPKRCLLTDKIDRLIDRSGGSSSS